MRVVTNIDSVTLERGKYYELRYNNPIYSTKRTIVMEFGSGDYILNLCGTMYPPKHHQKVYDLDSGKVNNIISYGYSGIALNHIITIKECSNQKAMRSLIIDAALET